ncbi:MAG: alpha/beta hydrolase [Polyangiaceae bacterium]|nr:alpha/beta hydrolase [Polyangiaceae bacterium]
MKRNCEAATNAARDTSGRFGVIRRHFLRLAAFAAAMGALSCHGEALPADEPVAAQDTIAWDKTFPESALVNHQKVKFDNRLGITLVGDLYVPKSLDRSKPSAAIIVGHPYGGVKEQTSGLYAQTMAERGFITLAFDASYNGESGGKPHFIASPEAFVEDFSAAVDYLGANPLVDRNRIGVIGVCGSGGFGLAAAEIDPRIKAVATVSMYDIGQARRQGLADSLDKAELRKTLDTIAAQRWAEVDGAERAVVVGTPEVITERSSAIDREFFDYYRTPRGHHPRSTTSMSLTSGAAMSLFWSFDHLDWISPRPVLFITGDHAHSRIFSEHAFQRASEPKELYVVPGAGHVDLYDRVQLIPWDKLTSFFNEHLPTRKNTPSGIR